MDTRNSGLIEVEGCFNVRDAGGWLTESGAAMRTGRLYRSDDPIRITEAGRDKIRSLGLRAVVDLRQADQVRRSPSFIDEALTHHLPLVDQMVSLPSLQAIEKPSDITAMYHDLVDRGGENLIKAVEILAENMIDGPVLVHCALGKDRTGMVVALIQAAVGVPQESIVADFVRSNDPIAARRAVMVADPLPDDVPIDRSPPLLWTAPAETMQLFTQQAIDQHGSLPAWPIALGVPPATVEVLRRTLL